MIFLDVGAHVGQTLEEVIDPRYRFERIYAFEPMAAQYARLRERFGAIANVTLLNYGLADVTSFLPVYGTNEALEASLYSRKNDVDAAVVTECAFRKAGDFFATHVPTGQSAIMKLNCEGAEIPIMHELIDTGQVWKLKHVAIDFDCRKIPGMETAEADLIDRLHYIGFDRWAPVDSVMHGHVHRERIAEWLDGVLA